MNYYPNLHDNNTFKIAFTPLDYTIKHSSYLLIKIFIYLKDEKYQTIKGKLMDSTHNKKPKVKYV